MPWPTPGVFGARLSALAVLLTSRFRLSRRDQRAFFEDLLDVPAPSLGMTQAFIHEASAALQGAYAEIRAAAQRYRDGPPARD